MYNFNKLLYVLFFCLFVTAIYIPNARAQSRLQQLDDRIMIDLANNRTPEQTGFFLFLSNNYRYGDIGIPAALLAGGVIGNNKIMRDNSLYVASSTAISYGFTLLLKHIVKRPRPFIQNINIVPIYRAGSTSFPSGHTSTTIATATALSIAYPKWYVIAPAYLWAGTIGYSRMYLGVHYPSDVFGGAVLGTTTSWLFKAAFR